MKPLRVAIITRRFWPLLGGPEKVLANLAAELPARSVHATILTARWQSSWSAELLFQDVPVVRLAPAPQGRCNTWRYLRSLARWLRSQRERLDLVYVSELRQEAYAAIGAVQGVPVVLRAERVGRRGDCLWQIDAPGGRRIKRRSMAAAGMVAPTRAAQRELQAAGYPRQRIVYLADGVPLPPPRTPATQAAARALWAETHPALQLPEHALLVVALGPLPSGEELDHLLAAWRTIAGQFPRGRLWLAGPAADRPAVQQQIQRQQLAGRVVAAGAFDQVDELLAAADLLLVPSPEGDHVTLLEAMAAGLPIVAADAADHRAVLADGQEGLLVDAADAAALSAAVARLAQDAELAARYGHAARSRAAAEFSLARMADQHVTWFQQLCTDRESSISSPRSTAQGPKSN